MLYVHTGENWHKPPPPPTHTLSAPTPPRNITVVGLTSRVLSVTWSPPLDPGGRDIVRYELEVRELGETVFEVPQSVGAEMTDARIVNREENTTYEWVWGILVPWLCWEGAVAGQFWPDQLVWLLHLCHAHILLEVRMCQLPCAVAIVTYISCIAGCIFSRCG